MIIDPVNIAPEVPPVETRDFNRAARTYIEEMYDFIGILKNIKAEEDIPEAVHIDHAISVHTNIINNWLNQNYKTDPLNNRHVLKVLNDAYTIDYHKYRFDKTVAGILDIAQAHQCLTILEKYKHPEIRSGRRDLKSAKREVFLNFAIGALIPFDWQENHPNKLIINSWRRQYKKHRGFRL